MDSPLIDLKYEQKIIDEKTEIIYDRLLDESENMDQPDFDSIDEDDLKLMFSLYDKEFFDGSLGGRYNLSFRLSTRLTRSAGNSKHRRRSNEYIISLSLPILFQTFHDIHRDVIVNGIRCENRLEAAMRVFEHELIHVIEWIFFGDSSHNRSRFKVLSNNIFGHTDINHQMVTQEERASNVYHINKGTKVCFEHRGDRYHGFVTRITKRATVMVEDPEGNYQDRKGKLYSKYYVPLQKLAPIKTK